MNNLIILKEVEKKKVDIERFKSNLTCDVWWLLMITERTNPWDVTSAIGYPNLQTAIEAIRAWIDDHFNELPLGNSFKCTLFCVKTLSQKLNAYYGHSQWQSPAEYER